MLRRHLPVVLIRRRGLPRRRFPRVADLLVQLVDLLEGEALGLVDHEVDEEDAEEAAGEPDEEDLGLQVGVAVAVVDEVRRRVGDGPVQQPVGRGGDAQGFGARLEREDLAGDDPGEGAPGRREEEDVDAHKGHSGLLPGETLYEDLAVVELAGGQGAADRDDELGHAHANGPPEEERPSAPFVDSIHAGYGRGDVDAGGNHRDDEAAGDTRVLEVLGPVIEDEVDACKGGLVCVLEFQN